MVEENESQQKKRPSKVMIEWEDFVTDVNDIVKWERISEWSDITYQMLPCLIVYFYTYPFRKTYKYPNEEARKFAEDSLRTKLESKNVVII